MESCFSRLSRSLQQVSPRIRESVFHLLMLFSALFVMMNNATILLLISASVLVSNFQHFGDTIHCDLRINQPMTKKMAEVVNSFCWLQPTFVIPRSLNKHVEFAAPHPGYDINETDKPTIYQAYYQWAAVVLFLQGILFFAPRYFLWNYWENGMIKALILNLKLPFLEPEESKKSCELLAHSLRIHWGHYSGYFRKYLLFKLLQFLNITCQVWLLNSFLGGVFSNFNTITARWFQMDTLADDISSPVEVFPRMTKCEFPYPRPRGGLQALDARCLLPLNYFNEKLFFFLCFWIFVLWFLAVWDFLHHILLCALPVLRYHVLSEESLLVSTVTLETLVRHSKGSDWFVLYLLSRNISCKHYCSVINQLTEELEGDGRRTPFRNEETTFV